MLVFMNTSHTYNTMYMLYVYTLYNYIYIYIYKAIDHCIWLPV